MLGCWNEAVPLVEADGGLLDGVNDDEPRSSRLASTDGLASALAKSSAPMPLLCSFR